MSEIDDRLRRIEARASTALPVLTDDVLWLVRSVRELRAVLAEPTTQAEADALGEAMRLEWCSVERVERPTESTWTSFARATLAVLRARMVP